MNYWSNQGKKHTEFITKEAWEDPPKNPLLGEEGKIG